MSFALTRAFLIFASALAHEGGHGPRLEDIGPGGGKLAAVILASDADKGAEAPAQAVAEWKRSGQSVEVKVWSEDRKRPLAVSGEVKWILLGKKLEKPVVFTGGLSSQDVNLPKADTVELILPNLGDAKAKHVVSFPLK